MKGVITMTNIEKFVDMVKNSDNIVFRRRRRIDGKRHP